ncbi:MAG: oxidoreductase [Chitinophagia bacterium]|jgi:predicted dehydrogenase|nr:oxidoreductase [Chitinophagia bacterium]
MIRTALVSYGMSGKVFHAPFIHLNPHYELVGSWERSQKNIQTAYPGTISFSSYEKILNDPTIDLVIVNSPNDTHYEYTKKALQAGKHVVTEKAFTVTEKEALELDELAIKMNKKLAVYHNRRYDADFLTLQKLIQEGKLGDFLDIQISFERYRTTLSPKVHKELPTPGAGVLYDLGPHLVDQAILLSGMPHSVFADIRMTRSVTQVDDYFTLLLYYPTHRILITSGMVFMQQLPAYKVYGTKGCYIKYRADIQEDELLAGKIPQGENWGKEPQSQWGILSTDHNGSIHSEIIPSLPGNYGQFYTYMADAILHDAPVPTSAKEGANIIKVLEAARKSARLKAVVDLY